MHSLLKRQLRKQFGDVAAVPPEWRAFIEVVDKAYAQFDLDRVILERSLELSSQEMVDAHRAEKESRLKEELRVIQAEKNRFQMLADSMPAGVLRIDADENCDFANQEWLRITSLSASEAQGKGWLQSIHPQDRVKFNELYARALKDGTSFNCEYRLQHKSGKEIWVYSNAIAEPKDTHLRGGMIFCTVDLTERKNALKQIERSQRLQSIGVLAGGIAHDLNNALAPITAGVDLFSKDLTRDDRQILDIIRASARRGAEMVRNLLTFAKGVEGVKNNVDVREIIREMEKVIRATFPKSIEMAVDLQQEVSPVLGNSTQLHQVFLNLAVNARDAMPAGGRLAIRLDYTRVDEPFSGTLQRINPGDYVIIHVSDTGVGMSPEVQDHIFEPFFTTKDSEHGTGLGLATVAGIVNDHKGDIRVYSTPGKGSRFSVYLPANRSGQFAIPPVELEKMLDGAGRLVLVVDDEVNIRLTASTILRRLNYRVIEAQNGAEALGKFIQFRDEICLVLTDIHMPGMDGIILIREARRIAPALSVIAMSGRLEVGEMDLLKGQNVFNILEKPFSAKSLTAAVAAFEERRVEN